MTIINELDDLISNSKNAQEVKRALAVKMILTGTSYQEIKNILQVSSSFIIQWKNQALFQGVESLKLQYKGSKSYLDADSKAKVIEWLRQQDYLKIGDFKTYLYQEYGVVYASNQSYYDLLKAAKLTWKKSQKKNPAKNEAEVKAKKEFIEQKLKEWSPEIEAGKLAVFMIDECHLLWGDLLGYVWGRSDIRIEIPIKNEKQRQTYYGALDYQTHEFIVQEYSSGNSENTVNFIKHLQKQRPGKRLAIFWDGASYHKSQEVKEYLKEVNGELSEDKWLVHCTTFAPNAPEQNPVEDIWLQTKNFLRQFYYLCDSFKMVKWLFKFFADGQIFDFPKLDYYGALPQMI